MSNDDTYFEREGRFKAKADLGETRRLLEEVRNDMVKLRIREQRIKVLERERQARGEPEPSPHPQVAVVEWPGANK